MASRKALVESELLLVQHRQGEAEALERLIELWERPLYYYVRRLVKTEEEAKDLTQDVWLNVVRKIGRVRDPAAFPAWLYTVARNRVVSHFRKTVPFEPLPEDGAVPNGAESNTADFTSTLNAEELHWGLSQLSPPHCECLILHFLEGFSLEEVGKITGTRLGTVKSRIHYAKKALRAVLKKEGECHEQQQSQG
jgi:RNA polymerase sigma-70 factor, ECF subfamily